jgi:hypothetical protein
VDYFLVCLLGVFVGITEIISRYKDDPFRALGNWAAIVYLLINAAASALALWLILVFDWKFGFTIEDHCDLQVRAVRGLVAGLGAMAIFRSSLFVVRVGNQDVGFGPSGLLTVVLRALDRDVDRRRARSRLDTVSQVMGNVNFHRDSAALTTYCIASLQNLSADEQSALAAAVTSIENSRDLNEREKAKALGLQLLNVVGKDVLEKAVRILQRP